MGLFAIADLHFAFSVNKPMDQFGQNWIGHSEKIIKNWQREITATDTVLVPGDISWAMYEKDAEKDLTVLDGLPGRKILLEGNHDYWWKSAARLERRYENMRFLKNDCDRYDSLFICGSRGWLCPNDTRFTPQDDKLYRREQLRLRLSLESAMRQGAKEILLMMHFPPVNDKREDSAFMQIIREYPIRHVVYGHLHGQENHERGIRGEQDGVCFHLVAADYLDFSPIRII